MSNNTRSKNGIENPKKVFTPNQTPNNNKYLKQINKTPSPPKKPHFNKKQPGSLLKQQTLTQMEMPQPSTSESEDSDAPNFTTDSSQESSSSSSSNEKRKQNEITKTPSTQMSPPSGKKQKIILSDDSAELFNSDEEIPDRPPQNEKEEGLNLYHLDFNEEQESEEDDSNNNSNIVANTTTTTTPKTQILIETDSEDSLSDGAPIFGEPAGTEEIIQTMASIKSAQATGHRLALSWKDTFWIPGEYEDSTLRAASLIGTVKEATTTVPKGIFYSEVIFSTDAGFTMEIRVGAYVKVTTLNADFHISGIYIKREAKDSIIYTWLKHVDAGTFMDIPLVCISFVAPTGFSEEIRDESRALIQTANTKVTPNAPKSKKKKAATPKKAATTSKDLKTLIGSFEDSKTTLEQAQSEVQDLKEQLKESETEKQILACEVAKLKATVAGKEDLIALYQKMKEEKYNF